MIWYAIERRVMPHVYPRWLEAWRVRRARRSLPPHLEITQDHRRRLFIDVSIVSKHDAGTGIQRVVRAVVSQLLANPPAGWKVRAVGATRKRSYHPVPWPPEESAADTAPIEARPGDVFLGLDFALDTICFHKHQLAAFKQQGGQLWFVMYDILPIQRPEWFSDKLVVRYRKWLSVLATLAGGIYCISPTVEAGLREEFARRYGLETGFRTHVLPMGWDLLASRPSSGISAGFETFLRWVIQRPTVLMVGTLEPRKGHADVLDAFDILWRQGGDYNFVIVGRPGWKNDVLQARLRNHPQNGEHLYWLEDASDEALTKLYGACYGVIVASHAEGFGLPLIEALGHGKPILARDIPVFRLHENRGVRYFATNGQGIALAQSVERWLADGGENAVAADSSALPTWADTASSIMSSLTEPCV
jgi:glycosyltransferase involved in cell wall biosynthesis